MRGILQTYSWKAHLDGKDAQVAMATMRELASRLVRVRPVLRGLRLAPQGDDGLSIQMRVAGHTRWEIQRDARKLIVMFIRRAFILPGKLELVLVATERNGRELYTGEGRTPMGRRPRAAQKADGTPWDDYEWWGDELPSLSPEEASQQSSAPCE